MVSRVCPSCSVISETEKGFCPECGTSYDRPSATAASAPQTVTTRSSPVLVLAVIGLVAYLFSWLSLPILHDDWYTSWEYALKGLSGFEALTRLDDGVRYAVSGILSALAGYVLLALAILSLKKSS